MSYSNRPSCPEHGEGNMILIKSVDVWVCATKLNVDVGICTFDVWWSEYDQEWITGER